jgi:hypothetical protein
MNDCTSCSQALKLSHDSEEQICMMYASARGSHAGEASAGSEARSTQETSQAPPSVQFAS